MRNGLRVQEDWAENASPTLFYAAGVREKQRKPDARQWGIFLIIKPQEVGLFQISGVQGLGSGFAKHILHGQAHRVALLVLVAVGAAVLVRVEP